MYIRICFEHEASKKSEKWEKKSFKIENSFEIAYPASAVAAAAVVATIAAL